MESPPPPQRPPSPGPNPLTVALGPSGGHGGGRGGGGGRRALNRSRRGPRRSRPSPRPRPRPAAGPGEPGAARGRLDDDGGGAGGPRRSMGARLGPRSKGTFAALQAGGRRPKGLLLYALHSPPAPPGAPPSLPARRRPRRLRWNQEPGAAGLAISPSRLGTGGGLFWSWVRRSRRATLPHWPRGRGGATHGNPFSEVKRLGVKVQTFCPQYAQGHRTQRHS